MSFVKRESYAGLGNSQWMAYAVRRTNVAMPNCFTYATARISEIVGHNQPLDDVKVRGAGDLWECHASVFKQSSVAVPGALAIYKGGLENYGHIAVVEVVGVNMELSQSNYGGNFFECVEVPKYVGSYYPGTNLRLAGFLVYNGQTANYSESKLINENGSCTLLQPVKKRRDSPDGLVAETLKPGKKLNYTQKWVGLGHRYVSWVETEPNGNKYRYFVAISGSEQHGKDLWADFGTGTASTSYSEKQLINENASCTLLVPINKRRDKPDGQVVETLKAGTKITYTQKWGGLGHRYVSWVETEPSGNKYRYFLAISGSETQGQDLWVSFDSGAAQNTQNSGINTTTETKAGHTVDISNVKHYGVDLSVHNPQGSVDLTKYDFAMIQSNFGEKTDNEDYKDKLFDYWVSEAKKAGIPFGVYCYDYAYSLNGAKLEAEYAVELAKSSGASLGVWIDMEDDDRWKQKRNLWTAEHCLAVCETFCQTVEKTGYYAGVYSGTWLFDNWLKSDKLSRYDKWVAEWKTNDGYIHSDTSGRGTIHQYSSKTPDGKNLDLDVMYADFSHYKAAKIEPQVPTVDPTVEPKKEDVSDNKKENTSDAKDAKQDANKQPNTTPDASKKPKTNEKKNAFSEIIKKIWKALNSTHAEHRRSIHLSHHKKKDEKKN